MTQVKTWKTNQADQGWLGRLTGLHWNATEKKVEEWWQWTLDEKKADDKKGPPSQEDNQGPGEGQGLEQGQE